MFSLPTAPTKPDSHASAYRVDEVNPTAAVRATGGGSVTFEFASPANNWFVPKLSYFDVRLKVVLAADGSAPTATDATAADDCLQFAEYPASHVIETFSSSVNGANLETVSDCAELSAIRLRTLLPRDFSQAMSDSYRIASPRSVGAKVNSATVKPGGSLQPWDDTTTTFSCLWQPPSALFSYAGSLPGLRQRMVLTLASNLKAAIVAKDATSAALFTVTIDSIKFFAAHIIPEAPIAPPRNVVLSLPMYALVKAAKGTNNATLTFSVAPSSDLFYVTKNSSGSADGTITHAAHMFQNDIKSVELSYAGQRSPSIAYNNLESGSTERDHMRSFMDFSAATGRLLRSSGTVDTLTEWQDRPIYAGLFEKTSGDQSTNLIVRIDSTNAGDVCVAYRHHKIAIISYGDDGIAQSCDVQENIA
jgi:hypothetical protein